MRPVHICLSPQVQQRNLFETRISRAHFHFLGSRNRMSWVESIDQLLPSKPGSPGRNSSCRLLPLLLVSVHCLTNFVALMPAQASVNPRDSLYYLSLLAHSLQNQVQWLDETTRNSNDELATSRTAEGRALTHLSTCLTRGAPKETSQVLAVTMSMLTTEQLALSVFSSPPGLPESSANISPSSSGVAEDAADETSVLDAQG